MARAHYTVEIRVLLCESCGAPLEAPREGGPVACAYCGVQNQITARVDADLAPHKPTEPIDEATRIERLRQQDGRPFVPPDSILPLLSGSTFDPHRVDEALEVYRHTRDEVRKTGSPEAAERLYFLTLIGHNTFVERGDQERCRALLETSLDSSFLTRHKQVIRALLATAAAKDGDLDAAERWLAPCDPRSTELESDSAYRNARAFIDTIKGNYRAVLETLGRGDEIPIHDARDPVCAVLRANAHERLGDSASAVAVLRARMKQEGAGGRLVMEDYVARNPELSLCPVSMPEAIRAHTEAAAELAARASGGGPGNVLLIAGVGMLAMAVFFFFIDSTASLFERLEMMAGPGLGGAFVLYLGFGFRTGAQSAAFLRKHGVRARGVVVGLKETGTKVNGVPMMELKVTVKRPDAAPYEASLRQLMPAQLSAQLRPGAEVPLRVHPKEPDTISLELD